MIQKVMSNLILILTIVVSSFCQSNASAPKPKNINGQVRVIHLFVALCDNKYQGIVPVPAKTGNGQDPNTNLYWGGLYGVRSYFKKSKEWKLVQTKKISDTIPERVIFKNTHSNYYLVADAYDGRYIKRTTIAFLNSCSGKSKDVIHINNVTMGINGNAALLAYIGHDGLMDFKLTNPYKHADNIKRDCIVLACVSKKYFGPLLKQTECYPLIWTSGLMCPEAYTLHDALSAYVKGASREDVRSKAVSAYDQYQKCGKSFADQLLVSGW